MRSDRSSWVRPLSLHTVMGRRITLLMSSGLEPTCKTANSGSSFNQPRFTILVPSCNLVRVMACRVSIPSPTQANGVEEIVDALIWSVHVHSQVCVLPRSSRFPIAITTRECACGGDRSSDGCGDDAFIKLRWRPPVNRFCADVWSYPWWREWWYLVIGSLVVFKSPNRSTIICIC